MFLSIAAYGQHYRHPTREQQKAKNDSIRAKYKLDSAAQVEFLKVSKAQFNKSKRRDTLDCYTQTKYQRGFECKDQAGNKVVLIEWRQVEFEHVVGPTNCDRFNWKCYVSIDGKQVVGFVEETDIDVWTGRAHFDKKKKRVIHH